MNRQEFERKNTGSWNDFEVRLSQAERGKGGDAIRRLPKEFRRVCYDLSLAQYRLFGHRICDRLNGLAIRGYRLMHRKKGFFGERALVFAMATFPQALRREWKLLIVSSMVFWLPFFAMWFSASQNMEWVEALLGPQTMSSLDSMYGKEADTVAFLRQEHGSNFMMFAHYINNNVGIDFRVFAGGIAFGLGTLFFLLFNGLHLGAAVGYVNEAGDPEKFWRFVSGHSSFELLGLVVVGMAGLKIGFSLLAPGQHRRSEALSKAGKEALPLLLGGASMTALAAVVEGFWSAEPWPAEVMYGVGITFWVLHFLYFGFVGRGRSGA